MDIPIASPNGRSSLAGALPDASLPDAFDLAENSLLAEPNGVAGEMIRPLDVGVLAPDSDLAFRILGVTLPEFPELIERTLVGVLELAGFGPGTTLMGEPLTLCAVALPLWVMTSIVIPSSDETSTGTSAIGVACERLPRIPSLTTLLFSADDEVVLEQPVERDKSRVPSDMACKLPESPTVLRLITCLEVIVLSTLYFQPLRSLWLGLRAGR